MVWGWVMSQVLLTCTSLHADGHLALMTPVANGCPDTWPEKRPYTSILTLSLLVGMAVPPGSRRVWDSCTTGVSGGKGQRDARVRTMVSAMT